MPGLVACGRRWDIGSDDFVFPGVGECIARGFWLIVICVVFHNHDNFACQSGGVVRAFYIGTLVFLSVQIVVTGVIVYISMQGSITEVSRRRHLSKFLYLKFVVSLPEVLWLILGTFWAFEYSTDCRKSIVVTVKIVTLIGWLLLVVLLVSLFMVFDPLGHQYGENSHPARGRLWELRIKMMCCFARTGSDERSRDAFSNIGEVFSDFFQDVDFVATDIAAAFALLHEKQNNQPRKYITERLPNSTNSQVPSNAVQVRNADKPFPNPAPWMTVPNCAYYMRFASASYHYLGYLMLNPYLGCCKLAVQCKCCSRETVIDDNCCQCKLAAIQRLTGVDEEDIVFASWNNKLYEIPFIVVVDHKMCSVIVSIRGTGSLRDAMTDMTGQCETVDLGVDGCQEAHSGILQSAKYIQRELQTHHVLEKAFSRGAENYQLVITGISLGAGAASLLSLLIHDQYPHLNCYAFSPPATISKPLSRLAEDFVCSIVLGDDVVARMALKNIHHLKANMLQCIRESNQPKYKILAGVCCKAACNCCAGPRADRSEEDLGEANTPLLPSHSPGQQYTDPLTSQTRDALTTAIATSNTNLRKYTPCFPPGHVLFIQEVIPKARCCGTGVYEAMWARADVFDEIVVTPKMLKHHFPWNVDSALQQLNDRDYMVSQILRKRSATIPQ